MKISNITLWVQENERSTKFYQKIGFKIVTTTDTHSIVSLDGFELVLVNMRDDDEFAGDALAGEKGKGMYIYIAVENADQTYMQLVKKGVQPATEPRNWQWGRREFIVKDPDGYKLCFSAPLSESM